MNYTEIVHEFISKKAPFLYLVKHTAYQRQVFRQ